MTGKTAINTQAVARHFLIQTAVATTGFTQQALSARHYRRDDDFLPNPLLISGNHGSGYFMPQGQWWFIHIGDPVVEKAQVCMAYSTAGNLHQNLSILQFRYRYLSLFQFPRRHLSGFSILRCWLDHLPGLDHFWYIRHKDLLIFAGFSGS